MAEDREATFICPACGEAEHGLPDGRDPQAIAYVELAELCGCEPSQTASFVFGDAHTRGFGGLVRDRGPGGEARERWVPPRVAVAYHYVRQGERLAHAEPLPGCYPQPLYRNRVAGGGAEDIFVATAFLPHGETLEPALRARGEALAKGLKAAV